MKEFLKKIFNIIGEVIVDVFVWCMIFIVGWITSNLIIKIVDTINIYSFSLKDMFSNNPLIYVIFIMINAWIMIWLIRLMHGGDCVV